MNKPPHFDTVVIGGGAAGTFCAYFLTQEGQNVLLVDSPAQHRPASLAAGAFITPKIGKPTPLSAYTDTAYAYAIQLYSTQFASFFHATPLLQIPKKPEDIDLFATWSATHAVAKPPQEAPVGALFIEDAGVVDAAKLLGFLQEHFYVEHTLVEAIAYREGVWHASQGNWSANHVVLAQGAMPMLIDEPYIQIRPIWGERIEIESTMENPWTRHRAISLSATLEGRRIVIGATHEQGKSEGQLSQTAISSLLAEAHKMLPLPLKPHLLDHRGGARAGTIDYLPLLGSIVDAKATLALYPQLVHGARIDPAHFVYHPNLSMINGMGGRGFVLGPWLAFLLSKNIIKDEYIPPLLQPQRLFVRYAKRLKKEK